MSDPVSDDYVRTEELRIVECPDCKTTGMVRVARGGDMRTCPECRGVGFVPEEVADAE